MKTYKYSEFTTPPRIYYNEMIEWLNIKGNEGYRIIRIDRIYYLEGGSANGQGTYKFLMELETEK